MDVASGDRGCIGGCRPEDQQHDTPSLVYSIIPDRCANCVVGSRVRDRVQLAECSPIYAGSRAYIAWLRLSTGRGRPHENQEALMSLHSLVGVRSDRRQGGRGRGFGGFGQALGRLLYYGCRLVASRASASYDEGYLATDSGLNTFTTLCRGDWVGTVWSGGRGRESSSNNRLHRSVR
jgi:hypothetical protein